MAVARRAYALIALLLLTGCGGLEDNLRDINRSLYRGMGGKADARISAPGTGAVLASCFNPDTGTLYPSQTGRCAPGYTAIPFSEAEQRFMASQEPPPPAQPQQRVARATLPAEPQQQQPPAYLRQEGQALCYDDARQQIFGADQCPPGSRWIDTPEAEALQRAALEQAMWCYYPSRHLLYRSRACRPGDRALPLAEAETLWAQLPAANKPRQRPGDSQRNLAPVPQVQSAPRGSIDATPLPAAK